MSEQVRAVTLKVNGEEVHEMIDVRQNLVDFLRERLELTGSHVGCEHGVCGACTVRLDGLLVRGCLVLAVQCAGAEVETIEGASDRRRRRRPAAGLHRPQRFAVRLLHARHAAHGAGPSRPPL
jgi:aerobic-type carbon monoxide dehydrogenase small subunit (CoxS/CutS family)